MDCSRVRDKLGSYVDGELGAAEADALNDHLQTCGKCAAELGRLRSLVERLEATARLPETPAPADMWLRIERRLLQGRHRRRLMMDVWRQPMAAAASLLLLLGISISVGIWVNNSAETVEAAQVDYSVLLDSVSADVDAAVDRFLRHYSAQPVSADSAPAAAPGLDFNVPAELPGGFRREGVWQLRFGSSAGVAARYRRGGEPLVVFFHPPMEHTKLGVHRESTCHVAGREGQRVEVEPWQLVHFTDPTTCHCLLSKVGDEATQAAIFTAIAPSFRRPAQTQTQAG